MAVERRRETSCVGIAEVNDSPVRKPEAVFLPMVDPVSVTLTEDSFGVVRVVCPFYKERRCTRPFELRRSIPRELSPMPTICRFEPAASHESPSIYTQAFEPQNFYLKMWEGLSAEAKTAATHASEFGLGGMEKLSFEGMCLAFQISKTSVQLIDELCENGVLEEWSRVDNLRQTMKQVTDGTAEDMEIVAGIRAEERKAAYYRRAENELKEIERAIANYESQPEYQTDSEFKAKWDAWKERTFKEKSYLRYSPGFQRFIDQYRYFGFPLRFTEDE